MLEEGDTVGSPVSSTHCSGDPAARWLHAEATEAGGGPSDGGRAEGAATRAEQVPQVSVGAPTPLMTSWHTTLALGFSLRIWGMHVSL